MGSGYCPIHPSSLPPFPTSIQLSNHLFILPPIHPSSHLNLSPTKYQKLLGVGESKTNKTWVVLAELTSAELFLLPSLSLSLSLPTVGSGAHPQLGDPMQADGPRGCRFAGQWFPESQSWHPSVPPFGEMSCITCRCGVSGERALCEVGREGLA